MGGGGETVFGEKEPGDNALGEPFTKEDDSD